MLKGEKHSAKELGQRSYFGEYYIVTNRRAEFYYEAKTDVETIGITKAHFLAVLQRQKAKGREMCRRSIERYHREIRKQLVRSSS